VEGSDLCLPQWEMGVMLCMYLRSKRLYTNTYHSRLIPKGLVKIFQKLNLNQSANVNLKPQERCVFRIYVMLFQVVTLFIKYLFRVRLPYLVLIRRLQAFRSTRRTFIRCQSVNINSSFNNFVHTYHSRFIPES
jgi:hypothetical protein